MMSLQDWELDKEGFLDLLGKLVEEGKFLQNSPKAGLIPEEDRAAKHILERLEPYKKENGGVISIEHIHVSPEKHPNRGNIILRYPADAPLDAPVVSYVGSHMDVVYANPDSWDKDPFTFIVEDDIVHGRGTTDCLGHCALLTNLFIQLAKNKPDLNGMRVVGVLICDEEAGGSSGDDMVGVEGLQAKGLLNDLIHGPLIWLDCADKQPNIGSGGLVQWNLIVHGKMAHSGFPHKAVNAIELGCDALLEMQKDFYKSFPVHEKEALYGFESTSSFKATHTRMPEGGINQIPGEYTLQGDVRLIPFYRIEKAIEVLKQSVERLNTVEELEKLQGNHGPDSKYVIRDENGDIKVKGQLELTLSEPVQGIACNLDSPGYKALAAATKKIIGEVRPLADTGTLPLVADLQDAGFDVQTIGYGVEDAYHADNEFARISDFQQGFKVLCEVIHSLVPSKEC